jgi:eukaryotic-like serine/threonine-protein kinase
VKLLAGATLAGRYRLNELLGQGGMGQVWAATHLITRRAVAVKVLILPRNEELVGQARARFVLEARSACAIAHPNVVEVFDLVDTADESPIIVMELLRGETLAQKLAREGALTVEVTARLLLPVVSAVGASHARGIIHRDLKPSNIFLSQNEGSVPRVKVLDFGIAKWLTGELDAGAVRTQTGSTLGTPCYMAPEQATGGRSIDHRVDVWSIGVILYECLSGIRPVEGETPAQIILQLLSSGIIPIEHLAVDAPPALTGLIGRMLSRDAAKRPEDLRLVFEVLQTSTSAVAPGFGPPSSGESPVPGNGAIGSSSDVGPSGDARGPLQLAVSGRNESDDARRSIASRLQRLASRRRRSIVAFALAAGVFLWLRSEGALAPLTDRIVRADILAASPPALPSTSVQTIPAPPPPILVDDFEDGDKAPSDPRFARWQFFTWNPQEQQVASWLEGPGDGSNLARHLQWYLVDTPNGKVEYTGAGIRTLASNVYIDLSRYTRIVFSHRYQALGDCKPSTRVGVSFGCPEYRTAYQAVLPASEEWVTVSVPFRDFEVPEYLQPAGASQDVCLTVVDGLSFGAFADLEDGECSSGIFSFDSVSLR